MRFERFGIVWERLAGTGGWAAESHMYVWYVSKHRHNNILGVFGNVWGAFGNASERFGSVWKRLGSFRCVLDCLGAVWNV